MKKQAGFNKTSQDGTASQNISPLKPCYSTSPSKTTKQGYEERPHQWLPVKDGGDWGWGGVGVGWV